MGRNSYLYSHAEAAKELGITKRWLQTLVRNGVIRPAIQGVRSSKNLYRKEDVHALDDLRTKELTMAGLHRTATQAAVLSKSTADRVDLICRLLGIDGDRLDYAEEPMFALYMAAHTALDLPLGELSPAEISKWAAALNGMDEAYLCQLEEHTRDSSPWGLYLQLANAIMAAQPSDIDDPALALAYSTLDAARKSLRHVAYFYVRDRRGPKVADRTFLADTFTDQVIAQLFPATVLEANPAKIRG